MASWCERSAASSCFPNCAFSHEYPRILVPQLLFCLGNRRMARSRRTMAFVILGQCPLGSMQTLQRGQRELHSLRNASMQSGWNMWPQNSSRMMVTLFW